MIKYLCFYDCSDVEGRNFPLAASTKIKYICNALDCVNIPVEIVSASTSSSKGNFPASKERIRKNIILRKFRASKSKNLFQKAINRVKSLFLLLIFLLSIKKEETLIVYHSLYYMNVVAIAKFFKKFKLVLEVEEIYGDVIKKIKTSEKEMRFFKKADAYIFPTELLNEKINKNKKCYCVIHGTYNIEKIMVDKYNDGKIHCVYAGTFDERKGGVLAAISAAKFLTDKYCIHVIGFGGKTSQEKIKTLVEKTSNKSKCNVFYDGEKRGEDYLRYIQRCHIGLSTQNPNAAFNDTSFPSKILSYMSNGLRVVSVRIPAIETSSVGDSVYFYNKQEPEEIAKAIMGVDINDNYDARKTIKELDEAFRVDVENMLRGLVKE